MAGHRRGHDQPRRARDGLPAQRRRQELRQGGGQPGAHRSGQAQRRDAAGAGRDRGQAGPAGATVGTTAGRLVGGGLPDRAGDDARLLRQRRGHGAAGDRRREGRRGGRRSRRSERQARARARRPGRCRRGRRAPTSTTRSSRSSPSTTRRRSIGWSAARGATTRRPGG